MLNKKFTKPSLFLYFLPYFAISWGAIYNLGYYSLSKLTFLLLGVLFISILFGYLCNINNRFIQFGIILCLNFFIVFLYGKIIFMSIYDILNIFIDVRYLRLRWFLLFLFIILLFISFRVNFFFKFSNLFSLVLFCLIIIDGLNNKNDSFNNISQTDRSQIENRTVNLNQKPILLIITDEYASPNEIYKINRDSTVFQFSQHLNKLGWITKNSSNSNEISTIHSISSLFNYNLSRTKDYSKLSIMSISQNKLLKNDFYNSMIKKKISIINFGIFDLGNSTPLTNLYNYPKNFIQQFLLLSISYELSVGKFNLFKSSSNDFKYLSEEHNDFILNKIYDTIKNKQTFVYAHLLMPHSPFVLNPEFKFKIKTTNNYISYWNFVNKKLSIVLKKLIINNKYRIILTGDHGYRSDKVINPKNTFTAFYGFKKEDVDKIQSVQDIGILINEYY